MPSGNWGLTNRDSSQIGSLRRQISPNKYLTRFKSGKTIRTTKLSQPIFNAAAFPSLKPKILVKL